MRTRGDRFAVSAAVLVWLTSCSDSPTAPHRPRPQSPDQAGPVTILSLRISGPTTIAPGESVQLTLTAFKSNGSSENVTNQAQWTSSSSALKVTATGLATGVEIGEASIRATFAERSASERVVVVPKNTFRLDGSVAEGSSGNFFVKDVKLTVISGTGQGQTTRSAMFGGFTLWGVAGDIQILLEKEGYPDQINSLRVNAHTHQTLVLGAGVPRSDYAGTYTLTISASPSCASSLPEAARSRVYTATIKQDRGSPEMFISLADSRNFFFGLADPSGGVIFSIGSTDIFYEFGGVPEIRDPFTSVTFLAIQGLGSARGTPSRIAGTLDGTIRVDANPFADPIPPEVSRCTARDHGFEMARQ